jgi:hypothetical membrane protein
MPAPGVDPRLASARTRGSLVTRRAVVHHLPVLRRLRAPAVLWAGVIAPLLFTVVYMVEGGTRPGYDPLRHQVSLLSLGEGGWIQTASFLVTGALLIAFAIALRADLREGPGARGVPVAIAVSGVGFVVAALFPTQPLFGYPPGTPDGMATDISASSLLHVTGAGLLFFGLVVAALVLANRDRRAGDTVWVVASVVAAVTVFVFFGLSGGGPSGQLLFPGASGLLQRVSLVVGLGWIAAIAARCLRDAARSGSTGET